MNIYKATLNDIEDLIQLRLDFFKMTNTLLSEEDEKNICSQLKTYFEKHIPQDDFIAAIAKNEDGTIASAAFLVIQEIPASPSFIKGLNGTLLNVITYPQFRRKGIATKVIRYIIDEVATKGVLSIDLSSTEDGKELYKKLGFMNSPYTSMRFKL